MAQVGFTVNRTGDLSRDSTVDWALEGTVLTGAPPLNTTTPTNAPYPLSQKWEQITFPNAVSRIYPTSDQHITTPFSDGTICDVANDWGSGDTATTMEVGRLTGTFPGSIAVERRAKFGVGLPHGNDPTAFNPDQPRDALNLKSHAVVSIIGNRLILFYYRLWETNGRQYSTCILSTDNGVTFETPPALGTHTFSLGSGTENFIPRGIIQPGGPSYGTAADGPKNTAPQWFDRNYFYVAGNDASQGGTSFNNNPGLIYLCRYQFQGTGAPTLSGANLRSRSRYAFFKGLDANGVPTWTANGGLRTEAGVVPIFRNVINGVSTGVGYFWQCHWHPALQQWIATWIPQGNLDGVSIAHAPDLWSNSWQMLANNVKPANVPAAESGFYLACSCPAAWADATKLGLGLSTFVPSPRAGDDHILTNSSSLVAITGPSNIADLAPTQPLNGTLSWPANDAAARTVTIATVGNARKQVNRSCAVRLSNPVNAVLGAAVVAETTIIDDDPA